MMRPGESQEAYKTRIDREGNTSTPYTVHLFPVMNQAQHSATYPRGHRSYRPMPDGTPDPPLPAGPEKVLSNFTPLELIDICQAMMAAAKVKTAEGKGNPVFGPPRPGEEQGSGAEKAENSAKEGGGINEGGIYGRLMVPMKFFDENGKEMQGMF